MTAYALLWVPLVNVWGKRFKLPQLTHESFLTIDHSCKIFFWYLPNWTSTNLWCVVLYATYSTTHQRSVEVQFGRYQKNILQEWCRVKKLSCVSCGSLKRFPHTFTNAIYSVFQTKRKIPTSFSWVIYLFRIGDHTWKMICPESIKFHIQKATKVWQNFLIDLNFME